MRPMPVTQKNALRCLAEGGCTAPDIALECDMSVKLALYSLRRLVKRGDAVQAGTYRREGVRAIPMFEISEGATS